MSTLERSRLDSVIAGLLAALVMTNIVLLILLRTGGPLIGLSFYLVLLALSLRPGRRGHGPALAGGLVGLAVHLVEVVALGWSDYAVLVAFNLVLPAALVVTAWAADRGSRQAAGGK